MILSWEFGKFRVLFSAECNIINNKGAASSENVPGHARRVKIQISLCIRTVWSESSLGVFWIVNDSKFLHADNEDSDQTARMRRLIWVFVGCTCQKVGFRTLRLEDF